MADPKSIPVASAAILVVSRTLGLSAHASIHFANLTSPIVSTSACRRNARKCPSTTANREFIVHVVASARVNLAPHA